MVPCDERCALPPPPLAGCGVDAESFADEFVDEAGDEEQGASFAFLAACTTLAAGEFGLLADHCEGDGDVCNASAGWQPGDIGVEARDTLAHDDGARLEFGDSVRVGAAAMLLVLAGFVVGGVVVVVVAAVGVDELRMMDSMRKLSARGRLAARVSSEAIGC